MTGSNKGYILVIEDDRGANALEAQRLAPLGLPVRSAYSAAQAEEIIREARPELMVLDHSLADASAMSFLDRLRAGGMEPPPFVLVTGRGDERLAVEFMKAGALDYLVKDSALLDTIADRCAKALESARLRRDLSGAVREAALERDRYKLLLESISDAIFVHELLPEGRLSNFIEVNDVACSRLGYSREELLRMKAADLDASGMDERRQAAVRSLATTGEARFETAHRARDGRLIPVEVCAKILEHAGRKLVLSAARDISEREEALARLRRSEAQFRALAEGAPEPIFVNRDGVFLYVNKALCALLGASVKEELLGANIFERIAPEFHAAVRARIRSQAEGAAEAEPLMEMEYIRLDGSRVPVETTAIAIEYEGRRGIMVFVRDISERKNIVLRLRESEERFEALFRQAPVGYQSLDAEGRILEVNEAWLQALGYSEAEVKGRWFGEFLAPEYVEAFRERFPLFKKLGKIHSEFHMLRKDGQRRLLAFDGRIGRDNSGGFLRAHCVMQDVTEARSAQEELKVYAARLEAVLANTFVLAACLDSEFNFIWVNEAYARACRRPRGFFPGKNHFGLYPHEENEAIFRRVLETGEPYFAKAKPFVFPDQPERGTTYWDWSLYPVKDTTGKVRELVFTLAEVAGPRAKTAPVRKKRRGKA